MTLPYRPSAVIFDMDGLLFDTEALWQEALLSAAAEGGHEIPDEVYNKSIGVRGRNAGVCSCRTSARISASTISTRIGGAISG